MSETIISIQHVSKSVQDVSGTLAILRDIDFSVEAGETVAILGASGSGKSTLLSLMAGLDTPSSGQVILAGRTLFDMSEDERAAWRGQQLGFVFQNFQLMGHLTALENVMLPLELNGQRDAARLAKDILTQVGLSERLQHFPKVLSGLLILIGTASLIRSFFVQGEPLEGFPFAKIIYVTVSIIAFALLVEGMRETLSTEKLADRIARMVADLEQAADAE